MKTFIDTNILVYALDPKDPAKQARARNALNECAQAQQGVLSTQVLQEFYVVATRKLGVAPLDAKGILQELDRFELVTVHRDLLLDGVDTSVLNQLSFWDGLIVAAAVQSRCGQIWSEDLGRGQPIQGVRVVNPLA